MLNEKQRRLVEKNEKLIYGFAHKHNINLEEYYGLLAIALCKAGETYQKGRGKFSTYAYTIMMRDFITALESKEGKSNKRTNYELNENSLGASKGIDSDLEVLDYLNDMEQQILVLKSHGYNNNEVAEIVGFTPVHVSRILNGIKVKLRAGGYN